MKHGQTKSKQYSMGDGAQVSVKPIRFCQVHGWVDSFLWRDHETCGCGNRGAAVEVQKVNVMRKAA